MRNLKSVSQLNQYLRLKRAVSKCDDWNFREVGRSLTQ